MPDLRNRIIGQRQDPRLSNFLGNVPDTSWMDRSYANPQVDIYRQAQNAYEDGIVQGLSALDPDSPTYQVDVQDYLSSIEDPNLYQNSPKLQNAVRSLASRYALQKQWKDKNTSLASQLALKGIDPDTIGSLMEPDGSINEIKASYLIGKADRGEKAIGKTMLSEKAASELANARFEATRNPTDEEKITAFQTKYGREPKTEQEWSESDMIVRGPKQAIFQSLVDGYERAGYNAAGFKDTTMATPAGTATTDQAIQSGPVSTGNKYLDAVRGKTSLPSGAIGQNPVATGTETLTDVTGNIPRGFGRLPGPSPFQEDLKTVKDAAIVGLAYPGAMINEAIEAPLSEAKRVIGDIQETVAVPVRAVKDYFSPRE